MCKSFRLFICCIAFLIAASVHGQAAECTLQLKATVDLKRAPDGRFLAPVSLEDHPLQLLLDTGAVSSILTQATVDALHLQTLRMRDRLSDVEGHTMDHLVEAEHFILDDLQVDRPRFPISPWLRFSDLETGGLLGADILRLFDLDLDPAANRMKLFSHEHCPGKVVYWTRDWVVSPMEVSRAGHIFIPVELDGKSINALIDTGATHTFLSLSAANRLFGLDADSPGVTKLGDPSKGITALPRLRYNFQTLSLEGILVKHPDIVIIPDKMASVLPKNDSATQAPLYKDNHLPDLIIGTSILDSLHIYIAYGEEKFYASAAGAHN